MNSPSEEDKFYTNIEQLADDLIDYIGEANEKGYTIIKSENLSIVKNVLLQFDKKMLIETFADKTKNCRSKIYNKDMDFFLKNADDIFSEVPLYNSNMIKSLINGKDKKGKPYLDDEAIEILWEHFQALSIITIKYLHKHGTNVDKEISIWKIKPEALKK